MCVCGGGGCFGCHWTEKKKNVAIYYKLEIEIMKIESG